MVLLAVNIKMSTEASDMLPHRSNLWRNLNKMEEEISLEERPFILPGFPQPDSLGTQNANDTCRRILVKAKWRLMFLSARAVIKRMFLIHSTGPLTLNMEDVIIFLYTNEVPSALQGFDTSFLFPDRTTRIVVHELQEFVSREKVMNILKLCLKMETEVISVVVVSSHLDFIKLVLNTVATESLFKWRHLYHITEWFVMSIDALPVGWAFLEETNLPDFVTFVSLDTAYENVTLNVVQKSRVNQTRVIHAFPLLQETNLTTGISGRRLEEKINSLFCDPLFPALRANAVIFLRTQKSQMAGMHVQVAALEARHEGTAYSITRGNQTYWTGFGVDALRLLSETLGFSYDIVPVDDGGFYGLADGTGRILGITGRYKLCKYSTLL